MEHAREQLRKLESDGKIQSLERDRVKMEHEITKLNDEMGIVNMQAETRAKLSFIKVEHERKQESLDRVCVKKYKVW